MERYVIITGTFRQFYFVTESESPEDAIAQVRSGAGAASDLQLCENMPEKWEVEDA